MDQKDKQKILGFVNHMLSIPNIRSEPPLIREGLIISFITKNLPQIRSTLASQDFFPHMNPDETLKMVFQVLKQIVLNDVKPGIELWLGKGIDFGIIKSLYPYQQMPPDDYRRMLTKFINELLSSTDARYNFNSVVNVFKYRAIERYVSQIFERRGFIFNEIRRVEKNSLDLHEFIEFTKLVFLIKNIMFVRVPISTDSVDRVVNINEIVKFSIPLETLMKKHQQLLLKHLPFVTSDLFKTASKACLKKELTQTDEASARLFYILASRYQEYKHQTVDRGAETLDKSWYNIARRNHSFYGFDEKMVNELYYIAGDNLW
jgi:hypothetical protein